jgi:hypothetical protein
MNPEDQGSTRTQPEQHEKPERTAAPPIEREHETYQGVFEEDEHRQEQEQELHHPVGPRD